MRILRSVRYNFNHGGVGAVFGKVMGRLRAMIRRADAWLLFEAKLEDVPDPLPSEGMELRPMSMADLLAHRFFKAVYYPEDLERRFAEGDLCLGVFLEGVLAHVAWMAADRLPLDPGVPDFPAPEAAGIYDMFTHSEHRGKGCQTIALRELMCRAAARGAARAVATVHAGNRPSIAAFQRCGFRVAGDLRYERVLWRSHLTLSPSAS